MLNVWTISKIIRNNIYIAIYSIYYTNYPYNLVQLICGFGAFGLE